jgi:hypothetical protein
LGRASPAEKSRFLGNGDSRSRDSVRMRCYCPARPSIWCWRDHLGRPRKTRTQHAIGVGILGAIRIHTGEHIEPKEPSRTNVINLMDALRRSDGNPSVACSFDHSAGKSMRLILCASIRPSIGTENLIPEEVNYTKITIRVTVMNKVQFLPASEPRKSLKPRSL